MENEAWYHLNYNGRVSDVQAKKIFGPDFGGYYYKIVSVDYDPETNRSRVGFEVYDV